jgi:hypothetical protein
MATSLREGWIKWTLGILGAIIVGALGSGLWESLLGPAIHAVSRWVLDIASLGLASYRNGVYRQIAADNQSAVGLETLLVINLIAAFAIGWLVTTAVKESMSVGSRIQHLLSALAAASPEPRPDAGIARKASVGRLPQLGMHYCSSHQFHRIARAIKLCQFGGSTLPPSPTRCLAVPRCE